MKQIIKTENGPYILETRKRFTGCFWLILLSLVVGTWGIFWLLLSAGTIVVGELTWTKFPFPYTSHKPLWQRVCYKGEPIYTGIFSQAIDINLNYKNLLIVDNYDGRKTYYDLKYNELLDNTSVDWENLSQLYPYMSPGDDRYITNIDSIEIKPEWKKLILSYQHQTPPAGNPKTENEIMTIAARELGYDMKGYTARFESPYYYVELTEFEDSSTLGGGPALKINAYTGAIEERYFTE